MQTSALGAPRRATAACAPTQPVSQPIYCRNCLATLARPQQALEPASTAGAQAHQTAENGRASAKPFALSTNEFRRRSTQRLLEAYVLRDPAQEHIKGSRRQAQPDSDHHVARAAQRWRRERRQKLAMAMRVPPPSHKRVTKCGVELLVHFVTTRSAGSRWRGFAVSGNSTDAAAPTFPTRRMVLLGIH